ncbi:hypothetical protein QE152_g33081 [Popillia japonica]|uniref:Uncharacterized protein n=1 Tax=Popillia japonica TaxID=7064 RepID=A0AAW1IXK5_POPJA
MKARVKQKSDLNRTGNKTIKLKDWEKRLLTMMEGDTNPSISQVPGAASIGAQVARSSSVPSTSNSSVTQDSVPIKKRKASRLYETDDTKYLTPPLVSKLSSP